MNNINRRISLAGTWQAQLPDGSTYPITLPGTLDENHIGYPDKGAYQWHPEINLGNADDGFNADAPIATRFTRCCTFEGPVQISARTDFTPDPDSRVFIRAERARCLKLLVNNTEVQPFSDTSISTPYEFEITGLLDGPADLTFVSDNSYPGLPHDAIIYSSAATDETQTNWNGIIGDICILQKPQTFIYKVTVLTRNQKLYVNVLISSTVSYKGSLALSCDAVPGTVCKEIALSEGLTAVSFDALECHENIHLWDEYEGNLYDMTASLFTDSQSVLDESTVTFGIRDFCDNHKGRLALNGRVIFIRSEANCAEFPESGHPPMTETEWFDILRQYKSYGINYMRFHSHCPPEAAFCAADRLGIMMQPELSHWNPKDAFTAPESRSYYMRELTQIITEYGNHPSFVALTLGNELAAFDDGIQCMEEFVRTARALDDTRLYAPGSNIFYGARGPEIESDFYTSQKYRDLDIRGTFANMEGYINNSNPSSSHNYNEAMTALRTEYSKPVFSFEVGQFEILPDFDELNEFKGISQPRNYELIRDRVTAAGLLPVWKKYVEATGELSLLGYREEVEAVLRTPELSGISLLGIQDFPGQGTALVGMLNSHLQPKPFSFASPSRFRSFFRDTLPLIEMPKYTYTTDEAITADIRMANYGRTDITGTLICSLIENDTQKTVSEAAISDIFCPAGGLTLIGSVSFKLNGLDKASALTVRAAVSDTEISNTASAWVYPETAISCPDCVTVASAVDRHVEDVLRSGGIVYFSPDSTEYALPGSIKAQFTSDFWSVGTFASQSGAMGQLIDDSHPVFEGFPTSFHTDWQWWHMAVQRAVILPRRISAIITEMDSYAFLRPMAQLFECRCLGGRVLFSSLGLHNLQEYPEARALLASIYDYLQSEDFTPAQELDISELSSLMHSDNII